MDRVGHGSTGKEDGVESGKKGQKGSAEEGGDGEARLFNCGACPAEIVEEGAARSTHGGSSSGIGNSLGVLLAAEKAFRDLAFGDAEAIADDPV